MTLIRKIQKTKRNQTNYDQKAKVPVRQRKSISESNKQMQNNGAPHAQHDPKGNAASRTKFPVYLPYSLRVLQWAGGAWPWLKNDTHHLIFHSKSTQATYVLSTQLPPRPTGWFLLGSDDSPHSSETIRCERPFHSLVFPRTVSTLLDGLTVGGLFPHSPSHLHLSFIPEQHVIFPFPNQAMHSLWYPFSPRFCLSSPCV